MLRLAKVIVKNKMSRFFMVHCVDVLLYFEIKARQKRIKHNQ